MGPTLTALVRLQAIEDELRRAKSKLRQGQQAIIKQEHQIKQAEAALAAKAQEIKLTRVQAANLEVDLKVKEDEITKLRVALNQAKSNKDYSTILTRLNVDKADKSKLEDRIIGLISQVDADRQSCREVEANIEQEKAKLAEIKERVAEKHAHLQAEVDRLTAEHSAALKEVPVKNRDMFVRLAQRYEGEAVAVVEETNARRGEYGCGGCFMSIPRELVSSLMTKDEAVTCPSCGRLLVLEGADKTTV